MYSSSLQMIVLTQLLCLVSLHGGAQGQAGGPNACGDGRIDTLLDGFEEVAPWSFCCSDQGGPSVALSPVPGCSGNALALDYSLTDGDYLIITRPVELNLSGFTHLRIALRGQDLQAHHNFQLKLADSSGLVYWTVLQSLTDLPAWRPVYIDLRELTCFSDPVGDCAHPRPLDLSQITRLEIAIARCLFLNAQGQPQECEPGLDQSVLLVDELGAVDLRPDADQRLMQDRFERVVAEPDVRSSAAEGLLAHLDPGHGLIPAFFQEDEPNLNTYSQAVTLLVFVNEYERTLDARFQQAANRLASQLLALQLADDKRNAGAWYTAYRSDSGSLPSRDPDCTGDEQAVPEIDRCLWIGNTAWATIALARLRNSLLPERPRGLEDSIARSADWMISQLGRIAEFPELATVGLEGNISAYFGLLAAGRATDAERLGDGIFRHGWDAVEQRMKIGAQPSGLTTAMDTAGSWGADFLRATGKDSHALSSQGFAATVLRTSSFDGRTEGYGDIAGPWTVTVEFGAQGAASGIRGANRIMEEILTLQDQDGTFPGSTDGWFGGAVSAFNTTMTGAAPTAWVYFAQNGDPLLDLCCANALFFAQFGNGQGFTSEIVLTNPSNDVASGIVRFFGNDGQPLNIGLADLPADPQRALVPLNAAPSSRFEFSVPAVGALSILTDGAGELAVGSAEVKSNGPLGGVVRFSIPGIGIAGVGASQPLQAFQIPVRRKDGINTGLALQNTVGVAVTLELTLRAKDGTQIEKANLDLMPRGHESKFVIGPAEDAFFQPTNIDDEFQGVMEVRVTGGTVAATAMELGSQAGEFTTLPVTPLE